MFPSCLHLAPACRGDLSRTRTASPSSSSWSPSCSWASGVVAVLGAVLTLISTSTRHRDLSNATAALANSAARVASTDTAWVACATPSSYQTRPVAPPPTCPRAWPPPPSPCSRSPTGTVAPSSPPVRRAGLCAGGLACAAGTLLTSQLVTIGVSTGNVTNQTIQVVKWDGGNGRDGRSTRSPAARARRGEDGFTLVELLVSVTIMMVIVGSVAFALVAVMRTAAGHHRPHVHLVGRAAHHQVVRRRRAGGHGEAHHRLGHGQRVPHQPGHGQRRALRHQDASRGHHLRRRLPDLHHDRRREAAHPGGVHPRRSPPTCSCWPTTSTRAAVVVPAVFSAGQVVTMDVTVKPMSGAAAGVCASTTTTAASTAGCFTYTVMGTVSPDDGGPDHDHGGQPRPRPPAGPAPAPWSSTPSSVQVQPGGTLSSAVSLTATLTGGLCRGRSGTSATRPARR